jgi:hypothetical protein
MGSTRIQTGPWTWAFRVSLSWSFIKALQGGDIQIFQFFSIFQLNVSISLVNAIQFTQPTLLWDILKA